MNLLKVKYFIFRTGCLRQVYENFIIIYRTKMLFFKLLIEFKLFYDGK